MSVDCNKNAGLSFVHLCYKDEVEKQFIVLQKYWSAMDGKQK